MNSMSSSKLNGYLSEYSESHQNEVNIKIHSVCVPLIMWTVIGFLHTFEIFPHFTVAYLFIILSLLFYASLKNFKIVTLMAFVSLAMIFSYSLIPQLRETCIVLFVAGWIGQFYGHKVEGKKPSFFKDLFFLLIGPVWVFKKWFPSLIA